MNIGKKIAMNKLRNCARVTVPLSAVAATWGGGSASFMISSCARIASVRCDLEAGAAVHMRRSELRPALVQLRRPDAGPGQTHIEAEIARALAGRQHRDRLFT